MTPLLSSALLRTQSDERLVRLVREGQERAFETLVDRYRKPLQRYCERALPKSRAEDVVQQVLTKAWLALRDGTEVRFLKAWLYRIAATTILETARTPGYDYDELRRSLLAPEAPESELEQQAVIRRTLAGLAALPVAQREALLRDAFEGQSRAQIAAALGVTEGAVRQLLHRARATLRAAATAVTPLPIASWLATGGSAPVAGGAVEGGAAGSIGVVGVAKVSAIVASAGVVATGSAGIHHAHAQKARKARAESTKQSVVRSPHRPQVRATHLVPVSRPSGKSPVVHKKEHKNAEPGVQGHERDSGESGQANQGDREVSRPDANGRDEPQSAHQQPEQDAEHRQPQTHHGDESDPAPPPEPDSGSGSGDGGD
jgi:RNA polymerase sigma factor (sigma-70 family)